LEVQSISAVENNDEDTSLTHSAGRNTEHGNCGSVIVKGHDVIPRALIHYPDPHNSLGPLYSRVFCVRFLGTEFDYNAQGIACVIGKFRGG
jgi:hypothetical protein